MSYYFSLETNSWNAKLDLEKVDTGRDDTVTIKLTDSKGNSMKYIHKIRIVSEDISTKDDYDQKLTYSTP